MKKHIEKAKKIATSAPVRCTAGGLLLTSTFAQCTGVKNKFVLGCVFTVGAVLSSKEAE